MGILDKVLNYLKQAGITLANNALTDLIKHYLTFDTGATTVRPPAFFSTLLKGWTRSNIAFKITIAHTVTSVYPLAFADLTLLAAGCGYYGNRGDVDGVDTGPFLGPDGVTYGSACSWFVEFGLDGSRGFADFLCSYDPTNWVSGSQVFVELYTAGSSVYTPFSSSAYPKTIAKACPENVVRTYGELHNSLVAHKTAVLKRMALATESESKEEKKSFFSSPPPTNRSEELPFVLITPPPTPSSSSSSSTTLLPVRLKR
jgi:hypothetical protein